CPTNLLTDRTCGRLFPPPGGEGQGEGNRGAVQQSDSNHSRKCRTLRFLRRSRKFRTPRNDRTSIHTFHARSFYYFSVVKNNSSVRDNSQRPRRCIARSTRRHSGFASGLIASARLSNSLNRSEEHTSELQSPYDLVCRLLL